MWEFLSRAVDLRRAHKLTYPNKIRMPGLTSVASHVHVPRHYQVILIVTLMPIYKMLLALSYVQLHPTVSWNKGNIIIGCSRWHMSWHLHDYNLWSRLYTEKDWHIMGLEPHGEDALDRNNAKHSTADKYNRHWKLFELYPSGPSGLLVYEFTKMAWHMPYIQSLTYTHRVPHSTV